MNTSYRRVCLVGAGLIGGSWGLALKRSGFSGRIVAYDLPQVLDRALVLGAIDESSPDLAAAVKGADLVILAAPVGAIVDQLPQVKAAAGTRALVTDTGSTKRAIVERAREIFGEAPLFLGGHPVAGKERSGIENSSATLFEATRYVLTPLSPEHLEDERVEAFRRLVKGVGAEPFVIGADAHDRVLAFLSHLPQLLATSLAGVVAEESGRHALPLELAAAGFRDMTRLAESPFGVWRDVCATNADNLRPALEALIRKLEAMKGQLDNGGLEAEFEGAQRLRAQWRVSR
ncbi:MAG TPA: prephenate dehydrogenase/arogenate dehydrogenase family protein [Terriglobia bacterium]|nr:prephenate dehydrogenase/arogenate dehydrogenase family protein [Terriglobia bacterium]